MSKLIALFATALCFYPAGSESRISYLWTFDELHAKSDVVVVAERMRTRDTNARAALDNIQPPFPAVELNTEFLVLTHLKGDVGSKTFTLHHYRTDLDLVKGGVVNGPVFLDFTREQTHVYLLFLTLESDGLYSPTSGHIDPDTSVFELPRNSLTIFPR